MLVMPRGIQKAKRPARRKTIDRQVTLTASIATYVRQIGTSQAIELDIELSQKFNTDIDKMLAPDLSIYIEIEKPNINTKCALPAYITHCQKT